MIIRRIKYVVLNGAMLTAVWFGVLNGHEQASNLVRFAVWSALAVSFLVVGWAHDEPAAASKELNPCIPKWIGNIIDLVIVVALAWGGWLWSAAAWWFHAVLFAVARIPIKKAREASELREEI